MGQSPIRRGEGILENPGGISSEKNTSRTGAAGRGERMGAKKYKGRYKPLQALWPHF